MNRPQGDSFVLIGGALPADAAEKHPIVSAAAARWQLSFAEAVQSEFNIPVVCLSFLPTGSSREAGDNITAGNVSIQTLPRRNSIGGSLSYFFGAFRAILALRRSARCVFCYNALVWTAPWAYLLGLLANAPVILIVADLDPVAMNASRRSLKGLIERVLLRAGRRFIVFSPTALASLPRGSKSAVFSGIADQHALALPPVRYDDTVRFVYAGRVSPEGGADIFMDAATIVAREHPTAEFHLFGRPSPDFVAHESSERISIHGFVPEAELDAFMGESAVGVNPRPGLERLNDPNAPYKLLYYLSRGMLAITTRTGGVPDELAELCIVADDSAAGIAAAMRKVLAMTPEERSRMAERARGELRATRSPRVLAAIIRTLMQ